MMWDNIGTVHNGVADDSSSDEHRTLHWSPEVPSVFIGKQAVGAGDKAAGTDARTVRNPNSLIPHQRGSGLKHFVEAILTGRTSIDSTSGYPKFFVEKAPEH